VSTPHKVWEGACEQARRMVLDEANFERQGDAGLEAAEHLGIIARLLKGIACKRCGGAGSTSLVPAHRRGGDRRTLEE